MRFILAILIVFFSSNCFAFWTKGTDTAPEVQTFCKRVLDDGGTVVDIEYMDKTVKLLKQLGIWSNVKFLGDANFAVKLDASGVSVQKLYDLSGNNNDAVQATVGNQPVWTAAVQGGRAGMVFDGTSDFISFSPADIASDLLGSVLLNFSLSSSAGYRNLFTAVEASTAIHYLQFYGSWNSSGTFTINQSENDVVDRVGGNTAIVSTPQIVHVISNGTAYTIWVNGVSQSLTVLSGANTGDWFGDITLENTVTLGAGYDSGAASNFSAETLFTVAIFNTALTTTQRTAIETFINQYYQIY
uniref:Lectin/glucanase superfamily protein n=1 Tax=viral metagenome TaxID=1070528 RepID=A0A6M3JYA1_9ZZZZ